MGKRLAQLKEQGWMDCVGWCWFGISVSVIWLMLQELLVI